MKKYVLKSIPNNTVHMCPHPLHAPASPPVVPSAGGSGDMARLEAAWGTLELRDERRSKVAREVVEGLAVRLGGVGAGPN